MTIVDTLLKLKRIFFGVYVFAESNIRRSWPIRIAELEPVCGRLVAVIML